MQQGHADQQMGLSRALCIYAVLSLALER